MSAEEIMAAVTEIEKWKSLAEELVKALEDEIANTSDDLDQNGVGRRLIAKAREAGL